MANKLCITLPVSVTSADLLNAGMYDANAVIRIQWSDSEAGAYTDLTGTGSTTTIPIVSGTEKYTGYDGLGGSARWYRSRIENAGGTRVSDWSPARATIYA